MSKDACCGSYAEVVELEHYTMISNPIPSKPSSRGPQQWRGDEHTDAP